MANSNLDKVLDIIDNFESLSIDISPETKTIDLIPDVDERIEFDDTSLADEEMVKVSLELEKTFTDIIKYFVLSVLCAEYISEKDFLEKIDKIKSSVEDIFEVFSGFPLNTHSKLIQFSSSVTICLEIYKNFHSDITNHYSNDSREYIFSRNKQLEKEIDKDTIQDKSQKVKIEYFTTILTLADTDHFPKNDNDHFIKLYTIKEAIDEVNYPSYFELNKVVKTKIEFLQHKWKERRLQENPYHSIYKEDGEEKIIQDFVGSNQKLNTWLEIFNTQYGISTTSDFLINNRVRKYKNKGLRDINYLQTHQLIKYFKDVESNQKRIEDIALHLKEIDTTTLGFYDQNSLNVFINYTLNNNFSKFIENNSDINAIKDKFDFTKANITGFNNNYFLEYKFLDKVLKLLLPKIDEEKENFIRKYKNIVNECENIFDSYSENVNWSIKKMNYIFALPFEESLIPFEIEGETYKVFFASSFTLPPSIKEIKEQYTETKRNIEKISSYTEFAEYFSSETKKINELKEDLKRKDFKSIEIIGIFTAMVTFVLSTIPMFSFIENVSQALLFMLTLSSALGIFIVLILISTRGFDFKKNKSGFLFLLILLVIASISFYFFNENKELLKKNKVEVVDTKKLSTPSTKKIK